MTADELSSRLRQIAGLKVGGQWIIGPRVYRHTQLEEDFAKQVHLDLWTGYSSVVSAFLHVFEEVLEQTEWERVVDHPDHPIATTRANVLSLMCYSNFRIFRGAEILSSRGYDLEALSLLRGVFDNLIAAAALCRKLIDPVEFEGVDLAFQENADPIDAFKSVSERWKKTLGRSFNLLNDFQKEQQAGEALRWIDHYRRVFHAQVHGGRLRRLHEASRLGQDPSGQLLLTPVVDLKAMALYINAFYALAFFNTRLLRTMSAGLTSAGKEELETRLNLLDDTLKEILLETPTFSGEERSKTFGSIVRFVDWALVD